MKTLSVVLATHNEEKNLPACLASVKGLAEEVIIVDEFSTDKTKEIAEKLGAKVYSEKHEPIFHITKNKAIAKAKSDWILQLDADERVTPEMKKEISRLLEDESFGVDSWVSPFRRLLGKRTHPLEKPAAAYYLIRRNLFLGRYLKNAGQYPDPVIRLFQRGKARLPAKDVHEQMVVDGSVGFLKSELDHLASPDFARYLSRENDYSSLAAADLKRAGVKVNLTNTINYLFLKPLATFLSLYIRYRGFLDGFPGFVFSLYSGFHHAFSYMKLWELYKNDQA